MSGTSRSYICANPSCVAPFTSKQWRPKFCSLRCANSRLAKRQHTCLFCGRGFISKNRRKHQSFCCRRCCDEFRHRPQLQEAADRQQRAQLRLQKRADLVARACQVCSGPIGRTTLSAKSCSRKCAYVLSSRTKRGWQTRRAPVNRTCRCGETFQAATKTRLFCRQCQTRSQLDYVHSCGRKYRDRARRFGVPFEPGVTQLRVFARDKWRCQLCGCSTPRALKGKNQPRSPELDHIVPLSRGGGHTYSNVQCACRQCNGKKSNNPLGQQRLELSSDSSMS